MRNRSKMEFSKKIFAGVALGTVIIVAFSMVVIWKTGDTSPLAYIIPGIFAELATATGFYYKKAEAENKIKLSKLLGTPLDTSETQDESSNNGEEHDL
ncbi:hypothetical protein [Biomaibacter acetigenes]|uniref:hypothetical protein n=1 Tax=Biomaibacter acetigenes TaxID=2316383 RepID=UPI001657564E|nr:hypothetical protein [Biomaibacter acetigenes]